MEFRALLTPCKSLRKEPRYHFDPRAKKATSQRPFPSLMWESFLLILLTDGSNCIARLLFCFGCVFLLLLFLENNLSTSVASRFLHLLSYILSVSFSWLLSALPHWQQQDVTTDCRPSLWVGSWAILTSSLRFCFCLLWPWDSAAPRCLYFILYPVIVEPGLIVSFILLCFPDLHCKLLEGQRKE